MDLADDCLAQLDVVIASIHSGFTLEPEALTDRLLRAIENPWVDALGHPTGRLLLRREPLRFDLDRVLKAAIAQGIAIEINSLPDRLDVGDTVARRALDLGATLIVSSDSHSAQSFGVLDWGIRVAKRAWATSGNILNTRPLAELQKSLRRTPQRTTVAMSKMLPMLDPFDEIKRIYFSTTAQTIERDIARRARPAHQMPDDEARDRVAGYMHGLADLRKEWKGETPGRGRAGQTCRPGPAGPSGSIRSDTSDRPVEESRKALSPCLASALARGNPHRLWHVAVERDEADVLVVDPLQQVHRDRDRRLGVAHEPGDHAVALGPLPVLADHPQHVVGHVRHLREAFDFLVGQLRTAEDGGRHHPVRVAHENRPLFAACRGSPPSPSP